MSSSSARSDYVERIRHAWATRYPELDVRPIDVIGRITRIGSLALTCFDRELEPSGISRSEFEVLSALARSDHPLRASEVTSITGISGASTTKHTERLATLGLVERTRLERDGRVVLLTLTDEGRALVEAEFPRRLARERQMLEGLGDDELQTLSDLLRRVVRNVENHYPN